MVKLKSTLSGKKTSLFGRKDWMIFRDVKHSVSLFRKLKMIYCCANCVLNKVGGLDVETNRDRDRERP